MVDWSGELEAAHVDGRVVPVWLDKNGFAGKNPDNGGDYWIESNGDYTGCVCVSPNGEVDGLWTIRNRQPQKTPEQRMEDLVRRMAETSFYADTGWAIDARSIVTELDRAKQDDADLAMAREVAAKHPDSPEQSALAAIRLIREKGNG